MLGIVLASLLVSAGTCYAIGMAAIVPAGSPLRSRRGVMVLIVAGLSFIPLPPQLAALDEAVGGPLSTLGASFLWPTAVDKNAYLAAWGIGSRSRTACNGRLTR